MQHLTRRIYTFLVAAVLAFTGFNVMAAKEKAVDPNAPAVVKPTEEKGISRITLTDQAAKRLGIQVAVAKEAPQGVEVPYSALLYEASGGEWVYINPEGNVYKRASVKVQRIDGNRMYLSKGPAKGTKVVTVGAAELFGAEFEIGH